MQIIESGLMYALSGLRAQIIEMKRLLAINYLSSS